MCNSNNTNTVICCLHLHPEIANVFSTIKCLIFFLPFFAANNHTRSEQRSFFQQFAGRNERFFVLPSDSRSIHSYRFASEKHQGTNIQQHVNSTTVEHLSKDQSFLTFQAPNTATPDSYVRLTLFNQTRAVKTKRTGSIIEILKEKISTDGESIIFFKNRNHPAFSRTLL